MSFKFRMSVVAVIMAMSFVALPVVAAPTSIQTEHFIFNHNGGAEGLATRLAGIAEGKRKYVRHLLGMGEDANEKVEVRIAVSDKEMQSMTGSDAKVDEWVAGLTFIGRDLIVISARGNEIFKASDTFVHELAHHYLDRLVGDRFVPRWFHEGFAMLVSSEDLGERMKSVLAAVATDSMIPLDRLEHSFPAKPPAVHLAYAQSMFFTRYLQRMSHGNGVRNLLDDMRAGMPFQAAFLSTWHHEPAEMFDGFKKTFSSMDSMLAFLTSTAVLWLFMAGIFVFVYKRKKDMTSKKLLMWELEEELQQERIVRAMSEYLKNQELEAKGPEEIQ
jgi:hypothetical protein